MDYLAKLQDLKTEQIKCQTQIDLLLKQLKDEFGLDSVEQAEAKMAELRKEYAQTKKEKTDLESKLEDLLGKIENTED